ncbi:MAG: methionine adenosyltransferase domain-containing protein, partial [Terrimicrobiaceae bacterium]
PYERQHRILLPVLEHILGELENKGLQGAASSSPRQGSFSMGQASSLSAARLGTTGFRVRSSLSITMVRGVPIGGGALCGKDPHKMDKCGALRARQLAKKLVGGGADEARVMLGWAPGGDDRW